MHHGGARASTSYLERLLLTGEPMVRLAAPTEAMAVAMAMATEEVDAAAERQGRHRERLREPHGSAAAFFSASPAGEELEPTLTFRLRRVSVNKTIPSCRPTQR